MTLQSVLMMLKTLKIEENIKSHFNYDFHSYSHNSIILRNRNTKDRRNILSTLLLSYYLLRHHLDRHQQSIRLGVTKEAGD